MLDAWNPTRPAFILHRLNSQSRSSRTNVQALCEKKCFLLPNKNGIIWKSNYRQWTWIFLPQFHNVTNNFNREMLTQNIMRANLNALLPYAPNGVDYCHVLIIAQISNYFGECSPIDSVSKIMKLCDYDVAKNSKFITYSLIFMGCKVIQ